jgi:carbamoyltransferase
MPRIKGRVLQPGVRLARRPASPRLNVIGISAGYHDSACCLLQDGVLVAAAQEERFSRVKNDKSMPRRAFRYCLEASGLALSDLHCIAYYEDPCLKLGRQLWMGLLPDLPAARQEAILAALVRRPPQQRLRRLLGHAGPIELVDHHLAHAASSYYFSGYDEAAILTVDGVGDWPTATYGAGSGSRIERFEQVDFPDSLGFFYSAITGYLGFEVNEGEYKVMGLAPYGEPRHVEALRRLIESTPGGQFRLNLEYFAFLAEDAMYSRELVALLGRPARAAESAIEQFHMDLARSVQVVLEEVLLEKVRYLHSRVPSENLCLAGGVALNVVADSRCLAEGPFRRLFVQPAAGDAGGAVGAAAIAHLRLTGEAPLRQRLPHVYLGPASSSAEVRRLLTASSARFLDCTGREDLLIATTVDRLLEGKIVGWSQGRMEFGPRALGARSILADARRPEMRDRINAVVKMREAFRPFAPAVLESAAPEHFDLDHPSPFMLETCQVISPLDLPSSITHVDGSARPQTVGVGTLPRFTALLEEFQRRTGPEPAASRARAEALLAGTRVGDVEERARMFGDSAEQLRARHDPLLDLAFALLPELRRLEQDEHRLAGAISRLRPVWQRAVLAHAGQPLAPDANGTLRVTLAHVAGYSPRDAVWMQPQTTAAGMAAKSTGVEPFAAPAALLAAVPGAPRSPYADPALHDVPVCFLADADTTGGNSGSPVLDARGQLVGINFDRVWENVANDFGYNPAVARNISTDIRYVLWVLTTLHGDAARPLLEELGIAPPAQK